MQRPHELQTIGDLRALLAGQPDDTPLTFATGPDVTGWTNRLLSCLGCDKDEPNTLVLAVSERAETERDISWTQDGEPCRPC